MSICRIEEKDEGRSYPRTCPTCKLTGACAKGLDRESLKDRVRKLEENRVRIKPLVWSFYEWLDTTQPDTYGEGYWVATSPVGIEYRVTETTEGWLAYEHGRSQGEPYLSLDDAQAAVQSDYVRRIKSTLAPVAIKLLPETHDRITMEELRDIFGDNMPLNIAVVLADRIHTSALEKRRAVNRILMENENA